MRSAAVVAMLAVFCAVAWWLQRESDRGSFAPVESAFLSWLSANSGAQPGFPELTLVQYDEESSELAGARRPGALDAALFARAAARLGAAAIGIEGVQGNPMRVVEAAGGVPVFGGFGLNDPPALGWTALRGDASADWLEVPGLVGRIGAFPRGFLVPPEGTGAWREIPLVARCGDRAVPSFLAVAWSLAGGTRVSQVAIEGGAVVAGDVRLVMGTSGAARFFPGEPAESASLNELLVAAEQFERSGGESPFRGRVLVLVRATPDVARVTEASGRTLTPAERWATAWEAARTDAFFLPPGWWYGPVLVVVAMALAFGPARHSWSGVFGSGLLAVLICILLAMGLFGGGRVLVPLVPILVMILAGLAAARLGGRAGWFTR